MFDMGSLLDLMKMEPGHGFLQSVLLFMIWWQSKGLRKEIVSLKDSFHEAKSQNDKRFDVIEHRITILEGGH